MRMHREPSLEGCTAAMQPGRSSFEASAALRHLRMTVRELERAVLTRNRPSARPFTPSTPAPLAEHRAMSDACDYFRAHAITAVRKARALPPGRSKQKQRTVARVYHLLSREAALAPSIRHLNDFRAARRAERQFGR